MKTLWKNYFLKLMAILICLPASFIAYANETPNTVDVTEITLGNNISIASSLTRNEIISRESAVKILTPRGTGSGTYFVFKKKHIVITAAHVVQSFQEVTILGQSEEKAVAKTILINEKNDFAVLILSESLETRSPATLKIGRKSYEDLVGKKIFYTGFPSTHSLLTIRGAISGVEDEFLILQSYAWSGASGSGVFDMSGNFIGTLTGVDIGFFGGSYHLIPAIVWISPASKIDMNKLETVVKSENPL